jgi:hypothetical protein
MVDMTEEMLVGNTDAVSRKRKRAWRVDSRGLIAIPAASAGL